MKCFLAFVLACGACACLAAVPAAPDAVSLDQAREEARTLLADDFRRLNTGRTTLLALAERETGVDQAAWFRFFALFPFFPGGYGCLNVQVGCGIIMFVNIFLSCKK